MKLYAIRTTDTKEWVTDYSPSMGCKIIDTPDVSPSNEDWKLNIAKIDTGHPCEWVEVQVIEARPVTNDTWKETVSNDEKRSPDEWYNYIMGFRAACEYLGIKIQEEQK